MKGELTKILSNTGWLYADKILRMGVGVIVGAWIARYLGPNKFGTLNVGLAVCGILSIVAGLGIQQVVVTSLLLEPQDEAEIISTAAALLLAGSIFAFALSVPIAKLVGPHDTAGPIVTAIVCISILTKMSDVAAYWFEAQLKSKIIVITQNTAFLVTAAIKVILINKEASLQAIAWTFAVEAVIAATWITYQVGQSGISIKITQVRKQRAKQLLQKSYPLLLSNISILLYMKIDQLMLAKMSSSESVGQYSAALRISEIFYFLPTAIAISTFPALLKAKEQKRGAYDEVLARTMGISTLLAAVVIVPMILLSRIIVDIIFGSNFNQTDEILRVHILASLFVYMGVASWRWYIAEGLQHLSMKRTVLGAIINISLNAVWIPKHGPIGAAWATVIAQAYVGIIADFTDKRTRPLFVAKVKSGNLLHTIRTTYEDINRVTGKATNKATQS